MKNESAEPVTLADLFDLGKRFSRIKDAVPGSEVVSLFLLGFAATIAVKSLIDAAEALEVGHASVAAPPHIP